MATHGEQTIQNTLKITNQRKEDLINGYFREIKKWLFTEINLLDINIFVHHIFIGIIIV